MKWFSNLKISAKLIIGFAIVAFIAAIVGTVGLINLNSISKADKVLYYENTMGIDYAGKAEIYYQRCRFNMMKMMVDDDLSQQNTYVSNIQKYLSEAEKNLKDYEDGIITETDRNLFDVLKPQWENYKTLLNEVIKSIQMGQMQQAKKLILGDIADVANSLQDAFDSLNEYNVNGGQVRSEQNTRLADNAMIIMFVVVILGVIIAIALGIFISRIISRPVLKMVEAADKLALGDVDVNVESNTKDEIGNLANSFSHMIANIRSQAIAAEKISDGDLTTNVEIRSENDLLGKKLYELVKKNNEVLSNIAVAAEQVSSGSKQVSDSSMALSQGATEQASSIEELTASLEEISSQTALSAQNANEANELAVNVKQNAVQGDSQMKEMLKAMEEINESSANISKIIKVIDEIAFQTNILALNAAVEAARAGQHGKGFAVVAEEVRNLAARSANAAKETTDMIEGSIKKTEWGTKIAQDTAEALNEIVNGVESVANLINDISIASNEQASAVGQINQGIMQVSQVVQANSATSEESAAASEELSGQAEFLKEMVGKFKLN